MLWHFTQNLTVRSISVLGGNSTPSRFLLFCGTVLQEFLSLLWLLSLYLPVLELSLSLYPPVLEVYLSNLELSLSLYLLILSVSEFPLLYPPVVSYDLKLSSLGLCSFLQSELSLDLSLFPSLSYVL